MHTVGTPLLGKLLREEHTPSPLYTGLLPDESLSL